MLDELQLLPVRLFAKLSRWWRVLRNQGAFSKRTAVDRNHDEEWRGETR